MSEYVCNNLQYNTLLAVPSNTGQSHASIWEFLKIGAALRNFWGFRLFKILHSIFWEASISDPAEMTVICGRSSKL